MHPLIAVLILFIAVLVYLSWSARAAATQRPSISGASVLSIVGMLLLAIIAARVHWLALLGVPLLALLQGLARTRQQSQAARGPSPGGASEVASASIRMHLDHDSGALDGEVLIGRLRGQRLNDLDLQLLLELLEECRGQDPDAVALLETYLDRRFGDAWREQVSHTGNAPAAAQGAMSREEALAVLGLSGAPGEQDIVDAHRRLIGKLHPDRGGSDYLSAKINQAKETLLG